jgi:hypothetical protein
MDKTIRVKADFRKLEEVIKGLSEANKHIVKVGVLANKNARSDGDSNATIGVKHEFGDLSHNLPQRSFIAMPLNHKIGELIGDTKVLIKQNIDKGVEGTMAVLKGIGVLAEGIIQDAFKTGGFGSWRPLRPSTIAKKGSSTILIETQQLRNSITSAVVKKGG